MTVYDMQARLSGLADERRVAAEAGLDKNAAYMRDLDRDLRAARVAYVGLGVTAIACLRGELFGRQVG